jgi:hypothetical protein
MQSERIVLIRSGRHLGVAVDALQERFPGAEIAVVGTPGSEPVITQAGIDPGSIFVYGAKPRFTPVAFALSRAALAARRWGFTRVAVLWNDPDGRGQGNVDRTAFLLAPRGFLAITPDGSVVEKSPFRQLGYEARRALTSLAVGVVLGALYVPAVMAAYVARVSRSEPTRAAGGASTGSQRETRPTYGVVAADTKGKAA